MLAEQLFSSTDRQEIQKEIAAAEKLTSGEIRVFVEDHCGESMFDRAAHIFEELDIKNTNLRNGVLIYLAVEDQKFCVIGDSGIHRKVGDEYWNEVRDQLQVRFRDQEFKVGLISAIQHIASTLQKYFPYQDDDVNELPDDIVFGS